MTRFLASVPSNVLSISWDKHHRMSFPWDNFLCISVNYEISAFIDIYWSLQTNIQLRTDLLHIAGPWETPATCPHTQEDKPWVECTSWQLRIPFWSAAKSIFLRTSNFFSVSSCTLIPQQQIMAPRTPQHGESRSKSSHSIGASPNASLGGAHQQCRH